MDNFGVDLLNFLFAETAEFAKGESFLKKERNASQRARSKRNKPENHGGGNGRFLLDAIQARERDNGKSLRAPTDAGQLHGRADHVEDKDENGIGESERAEAPAKTLDNQVINDDDKKPMEEGEDHGGEKIPPGLDGLHAAGETEQDAGEAGAPSVSGKPSLHAALENAGAVETKIDEPSDGHDRNERKNGASRARAFFKRRGGALGFEVARGFKDEQTDGGQDGGGGRVENALKGVDAEDVGNGDFVFAGNEERTDRLGGAAQKEKSGETGEVHSVNIPETSLADMGLELLPTKGANRVAGVNGDDGQEEVEVVCAADGVPKLSPAELAKVENASRPKQEIGDDHKPESEQQPLPRLGAHRRRGYWGKGAKVKRRKQNNSNTL